VSIRRLLGRARDIAATAEAIPVLAAGRPAADELRVFYGHHHIPRAGEHAHGGMVKIQRMQDRFPDASYRFNILYLVSSILPRNAVALAAAAQSKGARVVVNQNGVLYPGCAGPGWERVNAPMARLHERADYVFYQSEFCRESARRFLGSRSAPFEILYNAVDTKQFRPVESRTSKPLTLLLGGTQQFFYRVSTALKVLALVADKRPEVRLLVTGRLCWTAEDAAMQQALDEARRLGVADRVEWVGPYTQADAPALFGRGDILLHTKYNDPSPGLVTEALAFGLPVVYSATGGVPELVGGDAGVGVPADTVWDREIVPDEKLLAEGVLHVAERLPVYRTAARARAVARFDLGPWMDRHDEVFRMLLKGRVE
jgi:glycosyltransferase involved in cell wall biosynthesis